MKFSKREIVAMHFATGLIAVRDNLPDDAKEKSNAAVTRAAFSFADAFLDGQNRPARRPGLQRFHD